MLEEIKKEKKEIEMSARKKFSELPLNKQETFRKLVKDLDIGPSQRFLRSNGFSLDEAARFYIFISDLENE